MTKKRDKVSKSGAVELNEDALEQVSGGPIYIKVDGISGQTAPTSTTKLQSSITNKYSDPASSVPKI